MRSWRIRSLIDVLVDFLVLHDQVSDSVQQRPAHDRRGDRVERVRGELVDVDQKQVVLLADPHLAEAIGDRHQREFGAAFGGHVVEHGVIRIAVLVLDERIRVDVRVDRARTDQRDRNLVLDAQRIVGDLGEGKSDQITRRIIECCPRSLTFRAFLVTE